MLLFLIRVKVTEKVLPEYLVRFINSSMARAQMFDKAKSSSGIHNINSKELGAIKFVFLLLRNRNRF